MLRGIMPAYIPAMMINNHHIAICHAFQSKPELTLLAAGHCSFIVPFLENMFVFFIHFGRYQYALVLYSFIDWRWLDITSHHSLIKKHGAIWKTAVYLAAAVHNRPLLVYCIRSRSNTAVARDIKLPAKAHSFVFKLIVTAVIAIQPTTKKIALSLSLSSTKKSLPNSIHFHSCCHGRVAVGAFIRIAQ